MSPRELEERLELAYEAADAGTFTHDFVSGTVAWDDRLAELYGFPPSDPQTLDAWMLRIHEADRPHVLARLREFSTSAETRWDVEFRARHPNGTVKWIRALAIAERDDEGRLEALTGINVDITARKQEAASHRESESKLQLSLEAANLGAWYFDVETRRFDMDATARAIHRYERDEAIQMLPEASRHIHPDDIGPMRARFSQAVRDRDLYECEYRILLADGGVRWVASRGKPLEGTFAFVGVVRDITERRRTDRAIRDNEARLRLMIENAQHGLWEWNIATGEETLDDRWYAILGYVAGECPPSYDFWEAGIHPDDKDRVLTALRRHLESDSVLYDVDYRARAGNGQWVWINSRGRVHERDGDGRPLRMMGTIHDITRRKLEEAERERLEAQLRHAQKLESLGVLAGGIAHDFNNLLTAVLCNTAVAIDDLPADSHLRGTLHTVECAAKRASALTEQMLVYGGKSQPETKVFRLDALVQDMLALLTTVVSKKADLVVHLDPASVKGDPAQIQQVVMNLITNASEALGDTCGTIRVSTRVSDVDASQLQSPFLPDHLTEGRFVCFEVEDTGQGIEPEALARIFDPFFTTKFAGRGLGLAAVLGIVRGHEGTLTVDSAPGTGSRFRIYLPTSSATADEVERRLEPVPPSTSQDTVLVIDDEEVVRTSIQRVLERADYRVLLAGNGDDGLTLFDRHRTHIAAVLVDLTMPVLDGMEVLERLHQQAPHLPVLLMSGFRPSTASTTRDGNREAAFIRKPVDPKALVERINRLLSTRVATHQVT